MHLHCPLDLVLELHLVYTLHTHSQVTNPAPRARWESKRESRGERKKERKREKEEKGRGRESGGERRSGRERGREEREGVWEWN